MYRFFLSGILCCLFFTISNIAIGFSFNGIIFGSTDQRGLWASVRNPAAVASEHKLTGGFFYHAPFLVKELASSGFCAAVPAGNAGVTAISYQRFGYELFLSQQFQLSLARNFGSHVSAGVRFNLVNVKLGADYGKSSVISGTAGLILRFTENITVGVSVFNPQRAKLSEVTGERYPSLADVLVHYQFRDHASMAFGVEKKSDGKVVLRCGFTYRAGSRFRLLAGIKSARDLFYFGYAFTVSRFEISMISGYHHTLGFSPAITLTYK